jgi:hypothetical protein
MNKAIFQIGVLSFLVATVVFGTEGHPLLGVLSRAFVVFIGVVLSLGGILAAGIFLASQERQRPKEETRAATKPAQSATQ